MSHELGKGADLKPLAFRGGVGGGASQPSAKTNEGFKLHRPTPTPWSLSDQSGGLVPPSLKGRGLTPQDDDKRLGEQPSRGRGKDWNISAEHLAELHARATEMRRNPTEPEKRLWRYLSNSQLEGQKFRRQSVIGNYIADFACPAASLIVEVDGDTHDDAKDRLRDDKLAEFGFRVIRVTNHDVMTNMDGGRAYIAEALREAERPRPTPPLKRRGLRKLKRRHCWGSVWRDRLADFHELYREHRVFAHDRDALVLRVCFERLSDGQFAVAHTEFLRDDDDLNARISEIGTTTVELLVDKDQPSLWDFHPDLRDAIAAHDKAFVSFKQWIKNAQHL